MSQAGQDGIHGRWEARRAPGDTRFAGMLIAWMALLGCEPGPRVRSPQTIMAPPPSGTPVWGFGASGTVVVNPSSGGDTPNSMASDGSSIYVAGADYVAGATDSAWRIERRVVLDGTLVTGFGAGGVLRTNPGTGADEPLAVLTSGVYLYLVGFDSSPGDREWRIEKRQTSDGQLDAGFGTSGVVTTNPSSGADEAALGLQDSSALYLIGTDEASGAGDISWRIERRLLSDGSLDSAFGTAGVVRSNPSSGSDRPLAAAWDGTWLYIVGFDSTSGNRAWRIEKRRGSDGSLDSAFGTAGIVSVNPSTGGDEATGILLDSSGMTICGYDEAPALGNTEWRIERRSVGDGSLVAAFGSGGVVTSDISSGRDTPRGLLLLSPTEFLVFGADASGASGSQRWRLELRMSASGGLVTAFGSGGSLVSDPSVYDDYAAAAVALSDRIIAGGPDYSPGDSRWRLHAWHR